MSGGVKENKKKGVLDIMKYLYYDILIPIVEPYVPRMVYYKYNPEGNHTRVWGPKNESKKDVKKYKVRKDILYM